jgi:hypothetical protein
VDLQTACEIAGLSGFSQKRPFEKIDQDGRDKPNHEHEKGGIARCGRLPSNRASGNILANSTECDHRVPAAAPFFRRYSSSMRQRMVDANLSAASLYDAANRGERRHDDL